MAVIGMQRFGILAFQGGHFHSNDRPPRLRIHFDPLRYPSLAQSSRNRAGKRGGALSCSMTTSSPGQKTGAELREEFFLAAATGKERGLPEGAFLNDNVVDGPEVDINWEPYGDTCTAVAGSSLLKAGVDAGAFKIDNRFCLTGQCDVCIVEIEGGDERSLTCLVLDSDDAWDAMTV